MELIVDCPSPGEVDRVLKLMPVRTPVERRDKAIVVMFGLTAIRSTALVTLRLKHIDLEHEIVYQPGREVSTKFSKNLTTVMIPIEPGWISLIREYVDFLRTEGFVDSDPLFPRADIGGIQATKVSFRPLSKEFLSDAQIINRVLKKAFIAAGLTPRKPHSFRHMHAKLADSRAASMGLAKAIAANLGHDRWTTTQENYGKLTLEERMKIIRSAFDGEAAPDIHQNEIAEFLKAAVEIAKKIRKG